MTNPRRRFRQYSLRSFLIFTVICGLLAAHVGAKRHQAARQEVAIRALLSRGARITYANNRRPARSKFFTLLYGADHLGDTTMLKLDAPTICDEDLVVLEALTNVRTLELGSSLSDGAMVHVAKMKGLGSLYLHKSKITNRGLEKIAGMTDLRQLLLCNHRYDDDSLKAISSLNLESLNVATASITDDGLAHLCGMKRLKHIYVWSTPVTDEGELTLRKVFGAEFFFQRYAGITRDRFRS